MTTGNGAARALVLSGRDDDRALLGGKAGSLDELIGWGIPVPPSGAATTAAYRELVSTGAVAELIDRLRAGEDVDDDEVDAVFSAAAFEPPTAATIIDVASEVAGPGGTLAVRSSATVEDLAGSSFAGQYRSLLHIDPADEPATLDAVRMVFASLWHRAPRAYRVAFGVDDADIAMCAAFMKMVSADSAGVVFTIDPGGAAESLRAEAVQGLGESLVSGERTPEAWVCRRDLSDFDGPDEVRAAVLLSLRVEELAGRSQDIEWAWDGDTLWIVQARPITVAQERDGDGFDSPVDEAELTTAGIGEMLPGVLPPLRWALNAYLVNEAFANLVHALDPGGDASGVPFVRRVRGRAAMNLDALRALAVALPGGSAEELERQYFGSQHDDRPAPPPAAKPAWWRILRHDVRSVRLRRRATLDAEVVVRAVRDLRRRDDLGSLPDAELGAYRFRLVDLAARAAGAELAVAAAAVASYRKVELTIAKYLGEDDAGRWARQLTTRGVAVAHRPEASAALFAGPTWEELGQAPPVPVGHTAVGAAADADAARRDELDDRDAEDALLEELRNALVSSSGWKSGTVFSALRWRTLRQLILETIVLLHRREATKDAIMWLGGEVRRCAQEQGHRLVEAGVLGEASDVELLSPQELDAALAGRGVTPSELANRRRFHVRYESQPPLPARFVGLPDEGPLLIPEGDRFEGWAASPGVWTAEAHALRHPREDMPEGHILVAEATDASWSPLFVKAGGIIVERGGPLSHAAIIARELGVPAVLNVPGATRVLDGREVTVDGDNGVIVRHPIENDTPDRDEPKAEGGGGST